MNTLVSSPKYPLPSNLHTTVDTCAYITCLNYLFWGSDTKFGNSLDGGKGFRNICKLYVLFLKFFSIQSKIIHSIFICNNYFATYVCQQLFSEKLQTFFCLSLSLDTNWQLQNKEQQSAKTIQSQSWVLTYIQYSVR